MRIIPICKRRVAPPVQANSGLTRHAPQACRPRRACGARKRASPRAVLGAAGKLQVRPMFRTKVLAFPRVRIVVTVAAALLAMPAAASTLVDAIDQGIKRKNWTQVERGSLRWALEIDPGVSTVQAMAAAGMTDEAMAAAHAARPWDRPRLLMATVRGSDLPAPRRRDIVKAAFEAAQAESIRPEMRAKELADVAMAFANLGDEADARRTFDAALASAKRGAADGAYGVLVGGLVLPGGAMQWPIWMLDGVAGQTSEVPASDKVQVHKALAIGYFRHRQPMKARAHLETALAAARDMSERRARRIAIQSLVSIALDHDDIDVARRHGDLRELGAEMAAFFARRNEPAKALAEVAKLGDGNLYVSPKAAAAGAVIRSAIDRQSIGEAVSYCVALCEFMGQEEVRVRIRIGELQAKARQIEHARSSFLRAKALLLFEPYIGAREVQATLELALAAESAGLHALAKESALAAVRQTLYVSLARRKAERPLAEARASQVLSALGDRQMATDMLVRAWSGARDLPVDHLGGKPAKAEALLAMAQAARAVKPSHGPANRPAR